MISHAFTEERDATAKRETCAKCKKIVVPHEHTEQGWLCRGCTDSATQVRVEYIIDGQIFSKFLKGRGPTKVESKKGERKKAAVAKGGDTT